MGTCCADNLFYQHAAFKTDYSLEFFHNVYICHTNCSAVYSASVAVATRCTEDFNVSFFWKRDSFSAKCANDGFGNTGQLVGGEGGEKGLQFTQFQHFFLNLCMLFL